MNTPAIGQWQKKFERQKENMVRLQRLKDLINKAGSVKDYANQMGVTENVIRTTLYNDRWVSDRVLGIKEE